MDSFAFDLIFWRVIDLSLHATGQAPCNIVVTVSCISCIQSLHELLAGFVANTLYVCCSDLLRFTGYDVVSINFSNFCSWTAFSKLLSMMYGLVYSLAATASCSCSGTVALKYLFKAEPLVLPSLRSRTHPTYPSGRTTTIPPLSASKPILI